VKAHQGGVAVLIMHHHGEFFLTSGVQVYMFNPLKSYKKKKNSNTIYTPRRCGSAFHELSGQVFPDIWRAGVYIYLHVNRYIKGM